MYILINEIGLSIFLAMYNDDLLILSEDVDSVNSVKSYFSSEFELKIFQINGICLGIQAI
jgi:hypothetical protein